MAAGQVLICDTLCDPRLKTPLPFLWEADSRPRRVRRRYEKRTQFLNDVPQRAVVPKQRLLDRLQSRFKRGVGEQLLPHLDERPDDVNTHRHGPLAIQDRGCHDRPVLGENSWKLAAPAMAS